MAFQGLSAKFNLPLHHLKFAHRLYCGLLGVNFQFRSIIAGFSTLHIIMINSIITNRKGDLVALDLDNNMVVVVRIRSFEQRYSENWLHLNYWLKNPIVVCTVEQEKSTN